jgi:hypothetical protein
MRRIVTLERQITRADGTVEPPKVIALDEAQERDAIAFIERNPVKRLLARLRGVKGKVR